jgi:hypothetical protein
VCLVLVIACTSCQSKRQCQSPTTIQTNRTPGIASFETTQVNLTLWEAIMAINPAAIAASALMPPAVLGAIGWAGLFG